MNGMMTMIHAWRDTLPAAPAGALLLAKATLILAAGWLTHGMLARANPRWRVLAWRLAALGVLALPLTLWLGSPIRLRLPWPAAPVPSGPAVMPQPQPLPAEPQAGGLSAPAISAVQAAPREFEAVPMAPSSPAPVKPAAVRNWLAGWTPVRVCAALWLAGAALLALRWAAGWRRLRRLVQASRPAPEALAALARRVATSLNCRAAELRLAGRVPTPLLTGWRRPVLLLPARMAEPDYQAELPAIIAHEFSHVRAGDVFWTELIGALRLALWFHPLAWGVGRAHADACEEVSDAVAAAAIGDAGAYARTLARVAVELAELPPAPGGIAMARVPEIMRRLDRLRYCVFSHPLSRRRAAAFMACAALGILALGGLAVAPRAQEVEAAGSPAAVALSSKDAAKPSTAAPLPAGGARRLGESKFQQSSRVQSVAVSPDGKTIASGGWSDKSVHLWNANTGEKIQDLPGPAGGTRGLAFSPDGKLLAAVGNQTGLGKPSLYLWDAATWRPRHEVTAQQVATESFGRDTSMEALAFAPDSRTLATGGDDGVTRVWDAATGQELRHWLMFPRYIYSVAISPDGKRVAAGDFEGNVCLTEIDATSATWKIRAGRRDIDALTFSPDGKSLISGGTSYDEKVTSRSIRMHGTIRVWDAATGNKTAELESREKDSSISGMAWSPDRRLLAVGYQDQTIRFWDVAAGKEVKKFQGKQDNMGGAYQLAFTPDGKRLVGGGQGNVVGVWDVKTGRRLFENSASHSGGIRSLAWSPDGRILASGSQDQTVRLWDVKAGKQVSVLKGPRSWVDHVVFAPDGKLLAGVSAIDSAYVWEASTGKEVFRFPADRENRERLTVAAFSPTGDILALGWAGESITSRNGNKNGFPVRLFNIRTAVKVAEFGGHEEGVAALGFSADGHRLTSVSRGGIVRIWDIEKKTSVLQVGAQGSITRAAISADQKRVAMPLRPRSVALMGPSASGQGFQISNSPIDGASLIVFDIPADLKIADDASVPHHILQGKARFFDDLVFSPAGQSLISVNDKRLIQMWDLKKNETIGSLDASGMGGPGGRIWDLALAPDGQTLAAGMEDGTVLLWPVKSIK